MNRTPTLTEEQMILIIALLQRELQQTELLLPFVPTPVEVKCRTIKEVLIALQATPRDELGIPNLDCASTADLEQFENTFNMLRMYCLHKRMAMYRRAEGHINSALYYEKLCDDNYKQLPDWARW